MGDSEAAWLSWRPPPAGETPPGRSRATAISRASSANLPCFAGGRVRTRRASETSSAAAPLSLLLPLPLPGGRATALGCPLLVYLLRTGDPEKPGATPQVRCDHTAASRRSQINMPMRHQRRKHEDKKKKSNQTRAAVAPPLRKTPAGAPNEGDVAAGGDPSGSRRSISIQNHAYGLGVRGRALPPSIIVSSSWRFPPQSGGGGGGGSGNGGVV